MRDKIFQALLLVLFSFCLAVTTRSQYGSFGLTDARQLALGNTYASNSRELYAAGKNPSLLAYSASERKISILFPNLSMRSYNIRSVSDFFDEYFSQKPLDMVTGITGNAIKKAFENSGRLYLGVQIGFFAAGFYPNEKIGSFSIAWKDYLSGYVKLPKSVQEFHDGGLNFKGLYFTDFEFQTTWTRAYELSWGKVFHPDPSSGILDIYAGLGVKYYEGYLYNDIRISAGGGYEDENGILIGTYEANLQAAYSDDIILSNSLEGGDVFNNVPFMDPVGQGFGMDAGITLLLDPGVRIGVSMTDAGFMNWKGKTKQTNVAGVVRIDSTFKLEDLDSLAKSITVINESKNTFRTKSPSAIHIGFDFMIDKFIRKLPGEMNLAVELHQGMASMTDNPNQLRIAAGLDWKPGKWWPVMLTGITTSQTSNFAWSVGIGYELPFVEFYLSSPSILPVIRGEDIQTASISFCWHFVKMNREKKKDRS